jgi:ribosomal protein S17E
LFKNSNSIKEPIKELADKYNEILYIDFFSNKLKKLKKNINAIHNKGKFIK